MEPARIGVYRKLPERLKCVTMTRQDRSMRLSIPCIGFYREIEFFENFKYLSRNEKFASTKYSYARFVLSDIFRFNDHTTRGAS